MLLQISRDIALVLSLHARVVTPRIQALCLVNSPRVYPRVPSSKGRGGVWVVRSNWLELVETTIDRTRLIYKTETSFHSAFFLQIPFFISNLPLSTHIIMKFALAALPLLSVALAQSSASSALASASEAVSSASGAVSSAAESATGSSTASGAMPSQSGMADASYLTAVLGALT